MKKIICWLDNNLEIVFGSIIFSCMVIFTGIQILGRYVLTRPFPWTEEMTRYLFVWLVYFAIGYAAKLDKHIRISFIKVLLSKKAGYYLDIFSDLMFLVFAIVNLVIGYNLTAEIKMGGQTASTISVFPMWLLYLVMPLGFGLVCIRLVQSILQRVKSIKQVEKGVK